MVSWIYFWTGCDWMRRDFEVYTLPCMNYSHYLSGNRFGNYLIRIFVSFSISSNINVSGISEWIDFVDIRRDFHDIIQYSKNLPHFFGKKIANYSKKYFRDLNYFFQKSILFLLELNQLFISNKLYFQQDAKNKIDRKLTVKWKVRRLKKNNIISALREFPMNL